MTYPVKPDAAGNHGTAIRDGGSDALWPCDTNTTIALGLIVLPWVGFLFGFLVGRA